MKNVLLTTALLGGLGLVPVAAQMVFDQTLIEVTAGLDQDEVKVEFPFTVKGDKPVEIADYDAPCSCLEARISDNGKLVWKPGEKGSVQGIFKTGNFRGVLDKMIVMRMKGEDVPSVKLTVRMDIPVLLEVEPQTLIWTQGSAVEPKSFKLKVNGDEPMKIVGIRGTNDDFPYELKTIKEGKEYEITVTPKTLEKRNFGVLQLRTDSKYAKHARYSVYMATQPPGAAKKK
jgi:hypothetical protein